MSEVQFYKSGNLWIYNDGVGEGKGTAPAGNYRRLTIGTKISIRCYDSTLSLFKDTEVTKIQKSDTEGDNYTSLAEFNAATADFFVKAPSSVVVGGGAMFESEPDPVIKATDVSWVTILANLAALDIFNWGGYRYLIRLANGDHPIGAAELQLLSYYNGRLRIEAVTSSGQGSSQNASMIVDDAGYFTWLNCNLNIDVRFIKIVFNAAGGLGLFNIDGKNLITTYHCCWDLSAIADEATPWLLAGCKLASQEDHFIGSAAQVSNFVKFARGGAVAQGGEVIIIDAQYETNKFTNAVSGPGTLAMDASSITAFTNKIAAGTGGIDLTSNIAAIPQLTTPALTIGTETSDTIPFTWTDPNTSPSEANFELQRSDDGVSGWETINSPAQDDTDYDDTGRSASTTYYYRIRAIGDGTTGITSDWSTVVSGTTEAAIPQLSAPVLTAGTPTSTGIPMTWTDPNTSPNEASFEVQYEPTGIPGYVQGILPVQDAGAGTQGSLDPSTEYHLRIRAIGDGTTGTTSPWSNVITVSTIAASGYGDDFVLQVATTGADESFTLPLNSGSSYDFNVDWGDGSDNDIVTYDDANLVHTFAVAGTYEIKISGTCPRIYFNNSADAPKVTGILNWGSVGMTSDQSSSFYGCSITSLPTDANCATFFNSTLVTAFRMFRDNAITSLPSAITLSALTNGSYMFYANSIASISSSMTLTILLDGSYMFYENPLVDGSNLTLAALTNGDFMFFDSALTSIASATLADLTSGERMFYGNDIPSLSSSMTLSILTNGSYMFYNNEMTSLNNLTLAALADGERMFYSCNITGALSSSIVLANILDARNMFNGNVLLTSVSTSMLLPLMTAGDSMFAGVTLATENYSTLLVNIEANNSETDVVFSGGNSLYNSTGETARNALTGRTPGWTMTDGGIE